jgi:crossover junction endodeoxyribonuclease RusA
VTAALTFVVFGVAQPKGSTRAFVPKGWKRPIVTTDNPKSKGWQQLVAEAASRALDGRGQLFLGPVRLVCVFHLPRPKSLPRTRPTPMVKKPDVSKLARSTEDALTGVVWRDDSQVTDLQVTKLYAAIGDSPRAVITVEPLSDIERLLSEDSHGQKNEQGEGVDVRADSGAERSRDADVRASLFDPR